MARPATDAAMDGLSWVVGERYAVHDAVDHVVPGRWSGLPGFYNPRRVGPEYEPEPGEFRVRLIEDVSPHPRTRRPRVWRPADNPSLANELAELGTRGEVFIVAWVRSNGFLGLRANPREQSESVQEIRSALDYLRRARAILGAIRELKGAELRAEVERQMLMEPGYLSEAQDKFSDDKIHRQLHPMAPLNLARRYGMQVPANARWEGAGAYIQALYCLTDMLSEPLERLLRVRAALGPTESGMRVQGSILAIGPLATAYLQTLEEASWPTIIGAGNKLSLDSRAPRRCPRCGSVFKPSRLDQKWCGKRCRWAAGQAARRSEGHIREPAADD
jgi:hypothetical protein